MAMRRTQKELPDDDLLEDEEEGDEVEEEEEDEEPERAFPRWLKPLLLIIGLLIAGGSGAFAGYLWEKHHLKQNDIVATINGEPIDIQYLQHRMDMAAGNTTAHTVAQEILFLQYAKKEGALPSEQDVEGRYKEVSKDSKFGTELFRTHQYLDGSDVKRNLRLTMARTALLTRGVTVSDADAQKYYQANINPANPNAEFFRPETVLISVIVSRRQDRIEKAADALKAGEPFPTVAGIYSEDNSKVNGGQLPPIKRGQPGLEKSPELAKIIFSLKPKELTKPLKISGAYWLILCMDKQNAVTLPFERVRDAAYHGMLIYKGQQINGAKNQAALDAFQASSQIMVHWPNFADAITAKSNVK